MAHHRPSDTPRDPRTTEAASGPDQRRILTRRALADRGVV